MGEKNKCFCWSGFMLNASRNLRQLHRFLRRRFRRYRHRWRWRCRRLRRSRNCQQQRQCRSPVGVRRPTMTKTKTTVRQNGSASARLAPNSQPAKCWFPLCDAARTHCETESENVSVGLREKWPGKCGYFFCKCERHFDVCQNKALE